MKQENYQMSVRFWALSACFLSLFSTLRGQTGEEVYEEGKWKLDGIAGLNLSQTSLSNWAAGGENTVAGNVYFNGTLARKQGNWLWITGLALDYGLARTKTEGVRKSTDKIELSSQLGYTTDNVWFYTLAASLNTQFAKGYNYPDRERYISRFFAPAYSNVAAGMEYRSKSNYSVLLSPLSAKMTFVTDSYLSSLGMFGVKSGRRFRMEAGAYVKGKAEVEPVRNVKLITSADFFTPYSRDFGNVDVNWDVLVSMKVNRFLSATVSTSLKYDDDVPTFASDGTRRGAKVQFKEVIGVGLSYNF